jgi:hypothetical protein
VNVYIVQRPLVPGITRDARRLGVSRQYLSRVLHNQAAHEGTRILQEYRELKRREAGAASGF